VLEKGGFPYMVVGAHAVMVLGAPRFSADIDVVVHIEFDEHPRVVDHLTKNGYQGFSTREDEWGRRAVGSDASGMEIEVFFTPRNDVYDREFDRAVTVDVQGIQLRVISPEDLVLRKLVNCRLRRGPDFDDAVSVLRTQGSSFDYTYIRRHCAVYRVCALFDAAVHASTQGRGATDR
jgi:hypothetical protein